MGTPLAAIGRFWKPLSNQVRVGITAIGALIVVALVWLIEQIAGNAVSDVVNDWLVNWVGPILPSVWQSIATHSASLIAAVGLLWFALSIGYWIGLRDPVSLKLQQPELLSKGDAGATGDDGRRYAALNAVREIEVALATCRSQVGSGYGRNKEYELAKALEEYRPQIQANLVLIQRIGFPIPDFKLIDGREIDHIEAYMKEVRPYMERGLYPQGASRAAEETNRINAVLANRKAEN